MNILIERKTQSRQVASVIEDSITAGKLRPGDKLSSVRELAQSLSVGPQVIVSALDILEQKKLVIRKERFGVYVNHKSANPELKSVMFLGFGGTPQDNSFMRVVSDFMWWPEIRDKFDFYTRFIPSGDSSGSLETELARFERFGYPDCLVITGLRFKKRDVENALALRRPLLFVGNFADGDYPDLKYNRIGGDNAAPLLACLDYAVKKKHKTVSLLAFPGYLGIDYCKKAFEKAQERAAQNGLGLSLLISEADKKKIRVSDLLVIITRGGADEADILESFNSSFAGEIITMDSDTDKARHIVRDHSPLYAEMTAAIDKISSGKDSLYGIKDINWVTGVA
jgi:hypothetical protein